MEEKFDRKEILLRGKKRALHLLERKDYARKELENKLVRDGYETDIVEEIIAYVDSYHYLNDARVAENYIRGKKSYKSKRELQYLLKQKGIDDEEISIALEENYSDEEEAILRILRKHHAEGETLSEMTYEEKQKIAAKLYRKGFEQEKIRKMLQM